MMSRQRGFLAKCHMTRRRPHFGLVCIALLGLVLESAVTLADEPQATVRVPGIVLKWIGGDKEQNYRRAAPLIREPAKRGPQVVSTPDCSLDGYTIADKSIPLAEYRRLGEPIPGGVYFRRLAALAEELKIHLIAGMLETDGEARYNTAILLGPDGTLVGRYRKQKLEHETVPNTP